MVEEWNDCEELKPQPKRKVDLRGQEKGGSKASDGAVCRGQQLGSRHMKIKENVLGKTRYGKKNGQGEALSWCRKCSGYARQKMGPKLMNCCKLEQVGTEEHGRM